MSSPVTFDAQSFILNGERVFLTSGALHYFRVPRALWRDRLQKAREMGLNTVQLYFAWNWHEPAQDEFRFDGEHDVDEFLNECERQGLWIVARPGPYICAEWDGGGFPCWLYNIPNLQVRRDNAPYLERVAKYWSQLLPIIARHQIQNGGRVIMMQLENELGLVLKNNPAEGERYMTALKNIATENGIQVPFITCEGGVDWAIECVNAFQPVQRVAQYREKQPDVPLHSTEFWSGWYDQWSKPHATMPGWSLQQWSGGGDGRQGTPFDPNFSERETWRHLAYGFGGYDYYMWHGGTNFGYWGNYGQTTGYDYTAPLSEAGGLSPKYFRNRRVALFAQTFKDLLTNAPAPLDEIASNVEGVKIYRRASQFGTVLFIDNENDEAKDVSVQSNKNWNVQVPARSVRHIVEDAQLLGITLSTDAQVRCSSESENTIILYGAAGELVTISVSKNTEGSSASQSAIWPVPEGQPASFESAGVRFHLMRRELAERAWYTPKGLVAGAYRAGEDGDKVLLSWSSHEDQPQDAWHFDGQNWNALEVPQSTLGVSPKLGKWQIARADAELQNETSYSWRQIGEPTNWIRLAKDLPDAMGYAWYRHEIERDSDGESTLKLDAFADRALLFINGKYITSSEAPPEERENDPSLEVKIPLRAGRNTLAVLIDNLGHVKGQWQVKVNGESRPHEQDAKGIFGAASLDGEALNNWQFLAHLSRERGEHPRWVEDVPSGPLRYFRATFNVSSEELQAPDREWWIDISPLGKGVIWINGHNIGRYWNINGHTKYFFPKAWLREENEVLIFEEEARTLQDAQGVQLVWDKYAVTAVSEV